MKIVIVHNANQQPGGDDVVVAQESKLLQRAGHEVVFFKRDNWAVESYTGLQQIRLAKKAIWASDSKRDMLRLLRDEKPDLVHVHNTFVMISPSVYSACYETRVPIVQTLHNYRLLCPSAALFRQGGVCEECIHHSLLRSVRYGCYRGSRSATAVTATMLGLHRLRNTWTSEVSCFIALSEFSRNKFIEGGLPAHKIHVKPNFVDFDRKPRNHEGEYALVVGRLYPEKSVGMILKAWKLLHLDIPVVIIGTGPDEDRLRQQTAREGIPNVHFKGGCLRMRRWRLLTKRAS